MSGKIIAAGHICLDITPVFPGGHSCTDPATLLVPGKLINMDGVRISSGGAVSNTGIALKLLGADVVLMGKVGDDAFGKIVLDIAAKYGAGGFITDPSSSTSYSVVIAIPGVDRIFLHDPGANDTFSNDDIPEEALGGAVLFHFGYPSLMKRIYENDGEELIRMFRRMKEHGIATSLDLAYIDPASDAAAADWHKILENVLPWTDFFVPSYDDIAFLFPKAETAGVCIRETGAETAGEANGETDQLRHAASISAELIGLGAKAVLIKCGTQGMVYRTSGEKEIAQIGQRLGIHAPLWADQCGIQKCFRADRVLSTTGAGDASVAAFLKAVTDGFSPARAVALAAAEGACSVTAYDALSGLKSLEELEARIRSGWELS